MRKTKFVPAILAALLSVAGYGGYEAYQSYASTNSQTLLEQNVEALSENESGGSSTWWLCWSAFDDGLGAYKCGSPCEYLDYRKGIGESSKCYKNN